MKWSSVPTPVKRAISLTAAVVLGMLAVVLWNRYGPSRQTVTPGERAQPAQLDRRTSSLPERTASVRANVVDKAAVERKIPGALSERTLRDNNILVAKPLSIPKGWEYGYTVTPTIDNSTGDIGADVKAASPPFYEIRKRFEVEGRYLFAGVNLVEVDAKVLPIRFNAKDGGTTIEPVLFGGMEVRRETSAFGARAGVGVNVKW